MMPDAETYVALKILEKLVEQTARQPVITIEDMRRDVAAAWQYAEVFVSEQPARSQEPKGF